MNKRILQLAVPSILANITIPLVGLVDTAIVGHISDASAIGGIAIGTMLFDLLYWNFGFLRVGTSGMTAQAFGKGQKDECKQILTQSLGIVAIATVAIWLLQWLFVTAVLACVPCSPEVAEFSRRYFFVRIWAAPATLSLLAMKGWFIGMQDTVSPMAVDILVNVVNMVVSYVLAVHTPLGPIGVAYGTLVAQYSGLLLAVSILLVKYSDLSIFRGLETWRSSVQWSKMRRLLVLNGNLFVRSLCFMVVYVGFTSLASRYGDTELAVSAILMKLFMIFSYFVDGFAFAGEALVGRYIGERQPLMMRKAVRLLFVWSVGVGLLFTGVYAIWGDECIWLMTSDQSVIHASAPYMGWLIAMPIVSTLAFMWDGVFVGATAGPEIRNSMIWAALAFVAAYVACNKPLGVQAIYIAYFAHLISRVLYLTIKWKPLYDTQVRKPAMEGAQE
ncbi:MAG: MATE family efflux transporter [Paludibacteraceae bacterium]|nr:MATE family efflux transporter [Paludibacteraceae bacterium]